MPQQQQPPYGNPYPQQQPYGWGAPPVAPPPKGRRVGLVLGIVGGVVALGVASSVMRGVEEASGSFPDAEYALALPKTLVDGRYELAEDRSDSEGRELEEQADGAWDAKDVKVVIGEYALAGDQTGSTLMVMGMYGRFKYPDATRKEMMKGAGDGDGTEIVVPAQDFHPDGADGVTITCVVSTQTQLGTKVTVPACGWTDGNTGGSVIEVATDAVSQDPSEVDLDKAAATAAQVRSEMRKRIE